MSRAVRLGAVSYLNTRPLVHGLTDGPGPPASGPDQDPRLASVRPEAEDRGPALTLRFDVPAVCAQLLASGEIDLGLVPSITYLERPGDRVVPGVCLASEGAVGSVALFTRRPAGEIRTIAIDTSSRTSAVLTRILCVRRFELTPSFVPHAPDLSSMLNAADAALLIGDPALFADHQALGAGKIDLGAEWLDLTGLPFVWAFWSGRPGAVEGGVVRRLQRARDEGLASTDAIADTYAAGDARRAAIARAYLRDCMKYDLSERAIEGLAVFYREAAALGLAPAGGRVEFF